MVQKHPIVNRIQAQINPLNNYDWVQKRRLMAVAAFVNARDVINVRENLKNVKNVSFMPKI